MAMHEHDEQSFDIEGQPNVLDTGKTTGHVEPVVRWPIMRVGFRPGSEWPGCHT